MNKLIYEDTDFKLLHSDECAIPGYLVLWPKPAIETVANLSDGAALRLGEMLRRATAAINQTIKPERVYVICLAELDPRVHFHLFPRTRALTDIYRHATGYSGESINGLVFMQWARSSQALEGSDVEILIDEVAGKLRLAMAKQE